MNTKSVKIFKKIYRVIESCDTKYQIEVAKRYLDLAKDNGYIAKEFYTSIYFNIFLRKYAEILERKS
jgi:hypothetical protein